MANLEKKTDEELLAMNQDLMEKRGKAEQGFKTDQQAIQFELDKRAAKAQFGGGLSEAQKAALEELAVEKETAAAQEVATNG